MKLISINRRSFFGSAFYLIFMIISLCIIDIIYWDRILIYQSILFILCELILFILPPLYLILEYLSFNRNISIIISENLIIFKENKKEKIFKVDDISKFVKVATKTQFDKSIQLSVFDPLFFFYIEFNDGSNIFVSSLMARELQFNNKNHDNMRISFPSIKLYRKKFVDR